MRLEDCERNVHRYRKNVCVAVMCAIGFFSPFIWGCDVHVIARRFYDQRKKYIQFRESFWRSLYTYNNIMYSKISSIAVNKKEG